MQKLLSKVSRSVLLFIVCLVIQFLVTLAFKLVVPPPRFLVLADLLATVLTIAVPVLAFFYGSNQFWSFAKGMAFLFGGVILQFGFLALTQITFKDSLTMATITLAISQIGLIIWCLGLGATISLLLQDKNLILPVTIFLALVDIFLVLTPIGFTSKIMLAHPEALKSVALQAPAPSKVAAHEPISVYAYIGPADLIFITMFFAALHRFELHAKRTLKALIPTLAIYLGVVIFFGWVKIGRLELSALPALVPIGLVVLLTNLREFKLSRDEKISTLLVLGIATGVLGWALSRPPKPVEPEQKQGMPPSQALPESER